MARIGYRTWDDRPDAADWLLVCKPCQDGRTIGELLDAARANRHLIEHGELPPATRGTRVPAVFWPQEAMPNAT